MNRSKGPGSVLKSLTPVLETVQTRLVFKETSEGPKPEDLRPVSQGSRLMVSEGLGPGLRMSYTALRLRGPWPGLRKTWEPVLEGPGHGLRRPWNCF